MHRALLAFVSLTALSASGGFAQDAERPPTRNPHYQQHEITGKDGAKLSYWLMSPARIEAPTKYPLVLALHGRGGNTEAAAVLGSDELRQTHPCFVLAPAATRSGVWTLPAEAAGLRGRPQLPLALEALAKVMAEQPIDPDRIYVTGQSMGGFGTFGALAASPQSFAAAIPICGGWTPADAARMKDVPIWAFHGDADTTVPVERTRQMIDALKQAGASPKYTEYAGVGHNSWSRAYASPETWQWLFAQRRGK
jgi:predicted peptidase